MAIIFQFQNFVLLKERKRLKAFLKEMFIKEGKKEGNISFIFCSDDFLLDINKRFLSHDYYTDIITFDLSPIHSEEIDAEIFISGDRVKDNAAKFNETINNEFHRVMFHGILHLCGYKDKTPTQLAQMRKKENLYLKAYFN